MNDNIAFDLSSFPRADLQVISEEDAAAILGLSLATLRRCRMAGTGPQPVRLSTRRIGYRIATLRAWLAQQEGAPMAERSSLPTAA